jgi:tetratricopeptide (TPR) repeat protein
MPRTISILVLAVFLSCRQGPSQKDEKAIIQTIQDEKDGAWKRDQDKWAAQWAHEPYAEHTTLVNGWWTRSVGWDSVEAKLKPVFSDTSAVPYQHEKSGFQVLNFGNAAFVTCNERTYRPDQPFLADSSLDIILMEKRGGRWLIAKLFAFKPAPSKSPEALFEADINNIGYQLASNQKIQDALMLFRLNARLFPGSWNAYDSLGEIYMNSGQKALAIQNYEKSLKLNPQNKNAVAMLKKLKGR